MPFGPRLSKASLTAREMALEAQLKQNKAAVGFVFQKEPLPAVPWCENLCFLNPIPAACRRSLEKLCRLDSIEVHKQMASSLRPSSAFTSIFQEPPPVPSQESSSSASLCSFGPLVSNPFGREPTNMKKVCLPFFSTTPGKFPLRSMQPRHQSGQITRIVAPPVATAN